MNRSNEAALKPGPASPTPVTVRTMDPAASAREWRLCEIIGRSLDVDHMDRHDDFFDLGGTSLQAMEVMAAIEREFGRRLPVDVLIESPTPNLLAARLGRENVPGVSPLLLRFQAGDSSWPPLFLVHGLRGHVFLAPDMIETVDPRRPVYGIQARGLVGDESLSRSVNDAARDYLDAIEGVVRGGPFHLGAFCAGALIALEMSAILGNSRSGASEPILIDPPVRPQANRLRDRRLGHARLALRRILGPWMKDLRSMQRSLNRANEVIRYWRPDMGDGAMNGRLRRVAANMQYLLTCHILSEAPLAPLLLTSRQRADQVMDPGSFWSRMYGDGMRVQVVATKHQHIFTRERHRVFQCVNDLLMDRDRRSSAAA